MACLGDSKGPRESVARQHLEYEDPGIASAQLPHDIHWFEESCRPNVILSRRTGPEKLFFREHGGVRRAAFRRNRKLRECPATSRYWKDLSDL
jgi:hypothetical protein